MLNNLQDKIVKISIFEGTGKWRGIVVGKVMIVDHGKSLILSVREHPMLPPESLLEVFPWKKEGRYQCDVILKSWEEIK